MQKIATLFTLLLAAATVTLHAQVTITSAHMPVPHLNVVADQVSAAYLDSINLGSTGPGQSWDFSAVQTVGFLEPLYYLEADQAPQGDEFPTATLASTYELSDTADYSYMKLSSTEFSLLGNAGLTGKVTLNPALPLLEFPFHYLSSFNQTSNASGTSDGSTVSGTYSTSVVADAVGTVKTPLGTFPALRVKRINQINLTVLFFNIIQKDTSYEWLTTQYSAPVFSYTRSATDFFGQIEYSSYATILTEQSVPTHEPRGPVSLSLQAAPNPSNGPVDLSFELATTGNTRIQVLDAVGKTIIEQPLGLLTPGARMERLDLTQAEPGTYVALLWQNGRLLGMKQLVKM